MRSTWLVSFGVFSTVLPLATFGAPAFPTPATQSLLAANQPGLKALVASGGSEGIAALFGVPFATDSDPQTSTDAFVNTWLFGPQNPHKDALGVDNLDLDPTPVNTINIRNNRYKVFTYVQRIEGLQVHNSVVKIPVLLGASEKIGYIGTRLFQSPDGPLPADVLTEAAQAIAVVQAAYPQLTDFADTQKVIFQDDAGEYHRAWRLRGWNDTQAALYFVDTNSGLVVGNRTKSYSADLSGTVRGYATPCTACADPDCCPSDSPNSDPELYPAIMTLGGIRVTVQDGANQLVTHTLDNGTYSFTGLSGSDVDISADLTGHWVSVRNSPNAPPGVVDLEVNSNDVPPALGAGDLTFNVPPGYPNWPPTTDTGQVNAFLAIHRTHDWLTDLQDTFTGIDENVLCQVNGGPACNAGYIGGYPPLIELGGVFAECSSAASLSVGSHEAGHWILDRISGYADQSLTFHEGVADTISTLVTGSPCFGGYWQTSECVRYIEAIPSGPGAFNCGPEGCQVDLNDSRCDGPPGTPPDHYCLGQALSGAFWDLRKATPAADQIFADFLFITDGLLDESVLAEVLVADDADGDLSNGTGHCKEILCAFVGVGQGAGVPSACLATLAECQAMIGESDPGHGWTNPMATGSGVDVQWVGDVALPAPTSADFDLHYEIIPPMVTLKTTRTQGGDRIVAWFVGREDTFGSPLPIGVVRAEWNVTGVAENIIVNIGETGLGRPRCASISVVDIPAQGPNVWSDLIFEVEGDLLARATCEDNSSGAGGLVSGGFAGTASGVISAGVGQEGGSATVLTVANGLYNSHINSFASNASIEIAAPQPAHPSILKVDGALNGSITASATLRGEIRAGASSSGSITVDGDIVSPFPMSIYIDGDMSGDILATGAIDGGVTVTGTFTGNICGSNLSPDQDLPDHIDLTFGAGARVCGTIIMLNPPAAAIAPHDVRKNRYVSFLPNNPAVLDIAFRIKKKIQGVYVPIGWVGIPDANGNAKVETDPIYRGWPETVVHVGDCEVIPVADYELDATADGLRYSAPMEVGTILLPNLNLKLWGDLVGVNNGTQWTAPNQFTNVNDILAVLAYISNATIKPTFQRANLQAISSADSCLNPFVNTADVLVCVRAVAGDSYGAPATTKITNASLCHGACCNTATDDCVNDVASCSCMGANEVFTGGASCENLEPACVEMLMGGGGMEQGMGGGFGPEGYSSAVVFGLTSAPYQIDAGAAATVEATLDADHEISAVQVSLDVESSGTTTGTITREAIAINSARNDYIFHGYGTFLPTSVPDNFAGSVVSSGQAVYAGEGEYLTEYTLRASSNAHGVFAVTVAEGTPGAERSFVLDAAGDPISQDASVVAYIRVGVECTQDIHCDDEDGCTTNACVNNVCTYTPLICNDNNGCTTDSCVNDQCQYTPVVCNDNNVCTSDACVNHACAYTPVASGTACNDGLYCTLTDTCNGSGTCVGSSTSPCVSPNPKCCEATDSCHPKLYQCP